MDLNREQIVQDLCHFKHRILHSKLAEQVYGKEMLSIIDAISLINELAEENEKLNIDLEAMRCAANSYKMHCDKLSEEILNAFEQGQKQATSHTVAKVRDRLRDMNEFNLNADNGILYYIDLQAWMEEIEVDILLEDQ